MTDKRPYLLPEDVLAQTKCDVRGYIYQLINSADQEQ